MLADPQGDNPAALFSAAIKFHDGASAEEKSTLSWMKTRAEAQYGYENLMRERHPGVIPDNVETHNPIIDLFVSAWGELSSKRYGMTSVEDMPSWSKGLLAWKNLNDHATGSKTLGFL